jgi:hypothetical protein
LRAKPLKPGRGRVLGPHQGFHSGELQGA